MLASARCRQCDGLLPLRGGLLDLRLPPDEVICPTCTASCPTIVAYRLGWMEAWLHKVLLALSAPALVAWLATRASTTWRDWAVAAVGLLVVPWIASKLLGMPLTLLRDARRRDS